VVIFEVQTVTHQADLISFTWNDAGGIYNVYRDGELLYEGTVTEFDDGDFKHAKMYTYTIERVLNGNVVDVIALQTSAFAEQKSIENPLQSLVMTTIVAKTQIALSWEDIKEVDEYDIYRNGTFLKTVTANQFIDRDFSLDESYIYSIHSKRPLAMSEEGLSASRSVLAQLFGLLNPVSSKEEAAVEEFTVTKLIANPRKLLLPVLQKMSRTNVDRWKFRYTTFLTEDFITNPNFFSRNHYFCGDGRGFDPEGESYRTRVDVELAYDKDRMPMTCTKNVGQTIGYSYLKRLRERGVASLEGIVLERTDHGKAEAGFDLTHAVGNPLMASPEIDYEVRAVLRRDGTFDMTGFHDPAPHHEIYLSRGEDGEWIPVHRAESKGLAWMSGVIAWKYWRFSNFE
jgi:hypothetical protein